MVLDASVWVSLALKDDIHHQVSLDWAAAQQAAQQIFAVPTLSLGEVGAAVDRRTRVREVAPRAIADICRDPAFSDFPLDDRLAGDPAYRAIDLRLGNADAVYVTLAEQAGSPLVVWDRQIAARAARLITVTKPATEYPTKFCTAIASATRRPALPAFVH